MFDNPAAFGPNHDTAPVCLECLLPVDKESVYKCNSCGLPLCSPSSDCGKRRESGTGQWQTSLICYESSENKKF